MTDSGQATLTMRKARHEDAPVLASMCRACFVRSPEWYAPSGVIRRWWRGLIDDPVCEVELVKHDGRTIGYLVTTETYGVWRRWLSVGPYRTWIKLLVMLTRPVIFKSFLRKKLRARAATGASAGVEGGSAASGHPKVDREGVLAGREGLYLAIMAVSPDARGLGAGGRIVERFLEIGSSRAGRVLWLHVDPRNEVAQRLYQKHGFSIVGVDGSSLLMIRE
jgi:ribosomal protein S18 acetylase RimI-like enzyme